MDNNWCTWNNRPFFKRLLAYIIDAILVTIISTSICMALPNKDKENEERLEELATKLMENKVTSDEYLQEYKDITYDSKKNTMLEAGISLALTLAYFVGFQYLNKGQTLGKKVFNLRVVDNDTKKPASIPKGLLRSIFIFSTISSVLSLILIKLVAKSTFMNVYLTAEEIETVFIIITAIMVLYRKDGRGLHDMIAGTMVVVEEKS